ncbi:ribonuclease H family protein [Solibacillus sp. CAU 1738]|uniref:ribonuclease H family protein n=1 Tax=Solibacillus sp. CAU 1738 TaxID=3140363 RepID=UPI003260AA7B
MKIVIEWAYKTPKGAQAIFRSDEMSAAQALMIAEDLERTGRVKSMTLTDEYDSTWMIKELKKYLKEIETEPHDVVVYFDGGFDRATNQSGLGCVIYYVQNGKSYRLRRNAFTTGLVSNNEAEYAALNLSIVELESLNVHHLPVRFIGDSQVVINQMNGEWPAYEKELSTWADRIEKKLKKLGITPEYEHVSRKENAEADRLATQALNGIEITGLIEVNGVKE